MRDLHRIIRFFKVWLPTLFWGGMLFGHFPLIFRAAYRLGVGVESLQSVKSLLTLLVASAFFLFKLRGGKVLQAKPNFYQIVAFCLLGVFLHLFLFPPSVVDNPYEFFLLKCLVATAAAVTIIVLASLIRERRLARCLVARIDRLFILFRRLRRELELSFSAGHLGSSLHAASSGAAPLPVLSRFNTLRPHALFFCDE